jgi:hypothetical protein
MILHLHLHEVKINSIISFSLTPKPFTHTTLVTTSTTNLEDKGTSFQVFKNPFDPTF